MAPVKLDELDHKILKMLSVNARKPYLEIARACNVSGAAIHQRIQKLYNRMSAEEIKVNRIRIYGRDEQGLNVFSLPLSSK